MGGVGLIIVTLNGAVAIATPLLLATLGEIYAERSGVLNLGVEGMMIVGAFAGFTTAYTTGNPWLGMVAAALAGGACSLIHAFASITLRSNQILSGLALTMVGLGVTGVMGAGWVGRPLAAAAIPEATIPLLADIPWLGPIMFKDQDLFVYLAITLTLLLWLILYRTQIGLTIRAVGEHPVAADSLGVNVNRVRYLCVLLGGILAGLAGGYLAVGYRPAWSEGMTAGMGWLVIALTIFAFWNPFYGMLGAYLIGALISIAFVLQPWFSPALLRMLPYASAILTLTIVAAGGKGLVRRMGPPAALAQPYQRGETT